MRTPVLAQLALVAATGLAAATPAVAANYTQFDPGASSLAFGYSQMSVQMDGRFATLKASEFQFDPENPGNARVTLEVELASIDAGYPDANAEVTKGEWLDTSKYPVATFTSAGVKHVAASQYEVQGELSIKGNTRPVTIPFTFKEESGKGVFEGSFELQRADFGIGEGQWKDYSIVANEVDIRFKVVAAP